MPEGSRSFQSIYNQIKKWVLINKFFLLILLFYFIFNLINLTLLPIFNDESIYLDWGWIQTHWAGHEYDSMKDAKQPLMIWLFGIFANFFDDPLFAGRFVSVLFGGVSLIGIYQTSKKLFNKNSGLIAAFIYSITPIFVFYNRQALLESGLVAVGVWVFYYLLNFLEKPNNKNAIILGSILGIGFFIKSTSIIFILVSVLIIIGTIFARKNYDLIKPSLVILASIIAVDALILINPLFWNTLPSNSRYSFTLAELLKFPINVWITNFLGFIEIGFFSITPLVFLAGIVGVCLIIKLKIKNFKIFIVYFIFCLLIELFLNRSQSSRYLVPFISFFVISASYVFSLIWAKNFPKKFLVFIFLAVPFISSFVFVLNPKYQILKLSEFSKYADLIYLSGQGSGVGVNDSVRYIKEKVGPGTGIIVFGLNAGNPENAINVYAMKTNNLLTFHMDSKMYSGIEPYRCLASKYPLFFVTRNDELLGMERFFSLSKAFPSSENYSIKIYEIKKNCIGEKLSFDELYKNAINEELSVRPEIKY